MSSSLVKDEHKFTLVDRNAPFGRIASTVLYGLQRPYMMISAIHLHPTYVSPLQNERIRNKMEWLLNARIVMVTHDYQAHPTLLHRP